MGWLLTSALESERVQLSSQLENGSKRGENRRSNASVYKEAALKVVPLAGYGKNFSVNKSKFVVCANEQSAVCFSGFQVG